MSDALTPLPTAEKDVPCGPHCGPDFEGLTYHCPSACCHQRSAEKGQPMKYMHTHTSAHDGSPAMLVSQDAETITLINEDGYEWTDPLAGWCPIPPAGGGTDG